MGHSWGSLENNSAERHGAHGNLAQEASEGRGTRIPPETRQGSSMQYLAKNRALFHPCPLNLSKGAFYSSRLFCLVEAVAYYCLLCLSKPQGKKFEKLGKERHQTCVACKVEELEQIKLCSQVT